MKSEVRIDPMLQRKQLSKEQAYQKAKHYCAYQERSHTEVREKLYSFGIRKQEVEELISQLIEENCLNEERFAIRFAGGKFRMKQWGRIKIRYELKQKRVGEYCIRKALEAIDEEAYRQTIAKLAERKWKAFNDEQSKIAKIARTTEYLLHKGYESILIKQAIEVLKREEDFRKENIGQ